MKIYYYVHTGHRIGLDRFRRACTIIRSLGDVDITLLCSDFRIANEARHFGVDKAVGIDVVRNIPQIAKHGDKLIFDSEEANPVMLEDMRKYFSTFIRISDKADDAKADGEFLISPYLSGEGICNAVAVDDKYFENEEKTIELSYFFGDDDYEKDLEKNLDLVKDLNPDLLLGFYYFLDYEDFLKKTFRNYHEFEEYDEVIKKSKILITASPQAVLESLASGAKPVYLQREDYTTDFLELFETLNIPIVKNYEKEQLIDIISSINNNNYSKMEQNCKKIASFIKENLTL
ncbi:MAG TPA: hypothetical protein VIM82_07930 [Sulfurimonas sp.]